MKSFKEWCSEKYGIQEAVEGKIVNLKFVPSRFSPEGISKKRLTPADGGIYQLLRIKLKLNEGDIIEGTEQPDLIKSAND